MKSKTKLLATIAALAFGVSGFAQAQDRQQGDDSRGRQMQRGNGHRGEAVRHDRGVPSGGQRMQEGRGAGPDHAFYRGGRLPAQYRDRQYVVDDWRGHRLSAPPRGYHWIQAGGDYVLVAIATGVIASILLNR